MPPRPRLRAEKLIARTLLGIGSLSFLGGAWLGLSQGQQEEVARVTALDNVTPRMLRDVAPGTEVLLEGRLVARDALGPQGFVAYTEAYYLRTESSGASKGQQRWGQRDVPRPLLGVEQEGHVAHVCNRDYVMVNLLHTWQSDEFPREADFSLRREATIRRQGFKPGDPMTIDGHVSGDGAAKCLEARRVFGGDHLAYIDNQRQGVLVFRIVGAVFACIGAAALAIGGLLERSLRKKLRALDDRDAQRPARAVG